MEVYARYNNADATELKSHVYTLVVDGVEINVSNIVEFGEYNQTVRNLVMDELVILIHKEENGIFDDTKWSIEKVREALHNEAEINRFARKGAYKDYEPRFTKYFEDQINYSMYWGDTQDVQIMQRIMLAIICHIHSTSFYHDTTISWEEAVWYGKQDIFINRLTNVFDVA